MSRIDAELIDKLRKRLGIRKSRLYDLIQRKVASTHLDRRLATIVLASENGISIQKYVVPEDLATIRGVPAAVRNREAPQPHPVQPAVKKPKESDPLTVDIGFVSNKGLKAILQRDISELSIARTHGLGKMAKTCMVLSGSIAEALILSAFKKRRRAAIAAGSTLSKPLGPDMERWDLFEMVQVAGRMSPPLLPTDAEAGADQLRQWRNLIHPGRELRDARSKRISPTASRARNAISFLQFIAEELSR